MTDAEPAADLLERAQPRTLRHLLPPEVPWPAALVHTDAGNALLVESTHLPTWVVNASGEHVAAPIEIVRVPHGHAVLIPELGRPLTGADAVSAGGAITLAVSVLRGIRGARASDAEGEWWLGRDGRPLLVPVLGVGTARCAAAELLRELASATGEPVYEELADAMASGDGLTSARWEQRLFGLGEAGPVAAAVAAARAMPQAPPTRRGLRASVTRAAARDPARSMPARAPVALTRARRTRRESSPTFWEGAAARLSEAVEGVRRRLDGSRLLFAARRPAVAHDGADAPSSPKAPRRRGAFVIAAIAAAAVVIVGFTWPDGEDAAAPAEAAGTTIGGASAAPAPEAGPSTPASSDPSADGRGGDLAGLAREVLARARTCADAACRQTVFEDPARELPAGTIRDASDLAVSVIDDLGGIAVVRVEDAGRPGASQIAVLVSRDGKWLVRDVYDAAHQP